MKIVIASTGRAHLLDTARELSCQGNEIHFYSYTSKKNCVNLGFSLDNFHSLRFLMFPFLVIDKIFQKEWTRTLLRLAIDNFMALLLPKCDVFICKSPNFPYSMKKAKRKGALVLLDRGSTHVRKFNKLLEEYKGILQPEFYCKLDEAQYKLADYIVVGSNYVADSFVEYGIPRKRLFVNNYGFGMKNFYPTELQSDHYDLIFVGQWCKRKGCDLLKDYIETHPNHSLLHVGSIIDVQMPSTDNFKHIDSVSEPELIKYYSRAKVFILPSRDEGLALVQLQAVACGLPLVITYNTGGSDLLQYIDDNKWINIMQSFSMTEMELKVETAIKLADSQHGCRQYCHDLENKVSWYAYGKRYNEFLKSI